MYQFHILITFWVFEPWKLYLRCEYLRIISFFPLIKMSIGPLLLKISSKNDFFMFSETLKLATLTRRIRIFWRHSHRHSWISGFGLKISVAIFCTSWKVISMRIGWFRVVRKYAVLSKISCFFHWNQHFKSKRFFNCYTYFKVWIQWFLSKNVGLIMNF